VPKKRQSGPKLSKNSDEGDINMSNVETHIQEYKKAIHQIIKEKDIKQAKNMIREIGSLDFNLRNAVTGNAIDVQYLRQINDDFGSLRWKDANKARQLVNQGLQLVAAGKTTSIRPILVQVIGLMHDDDKPKQTLG
jgi:molecular chaperone DnaK